MNSRNHQGQLSGAAGPVDLRLALEEAGWRTTRQREAVYAYLCAAQSHPTAEQVFTSVREQIPNISLATVYKALEALVSAGVAARIGGEGAGPARYDCRGDSHYHFRCLQTGDVYDLELPYDPDLLQKIDPSLLKSLSDQGFEITGHRLEIVGRRVRM